MRPGRGTLALVALLAACAGPGAGPPTVRFTPIPEAEAARARDVHRHGTAPLCQGCHEAGAPAPALRGDPISLCKSCHRLSHGNHPVGVVPASGAGPLPLWRGQVACHSCHDPHDVRGKRWLRLPGNELCLACHARHGAGQAR